MPELKLFQGRMSMFPGLPRYLFVNGKYLGTVKRAEATFNVHEGPSTVRVQSIVPFLSSSAYLVISEDCENCLAFSDKGMIWKGVIALYVIISVISHFIHHNRLAALLRLSKVGLFTIWIASVAARRNDYFKIFAYNKVNMHEYGPEYYT